MIDVVVPVYATTDHLRTMAVDSIRCLRDVTQRPIRVIVVDNGSDTRREFGGDVYVRLPVNRGYAGGVNVGMSYATSTMVVVSSIDVFVRHRWERLVNAAYVFNGIATPAAERVIDGEPTGEREQPDCDYWGGIMAFPRSMYVAIGGLDEVNFPLRHSDTDFAIRAVKAGYWVGRVPTVTVEHRDPSMSTLLMGVDEVAAEFDRLHTVHGDFDPYAWRAAAFA